MEAAKKALKALRIENVHFSYSESEVLKDISFEVEKGDFIGLIGPNGSGKTTLLKIILGLLHPKKGRVMLFEKDIRKFKGWSKIGYVPQKATNIEDNFPATVYEIVSMGLLSTKHFPKLITKKDDEKIIGALKTVNMEKYADRRITDLSGGQQQRVLIAKALVTSPEILILDEPTTGIDQENQIAFYDLLGRLNKEEKLTIMLVSHDLSRITNHVTKIASINQTLNFYGSHKEFCSKDPMHKHEHALCLDRG